ncbi:hypothetical protein AX16_008186 [Volvariella volvacea WC 439]|nr:hypothetical protein AX16_008186 [Volvariella volvacea WC 439]
MSQQTPPTPRIPATPAARRTPRFSPLNPTPARKGAIPTGPSSVTRRSSVSGLTSTGHGPKTQRTSKTSQKLVVLPSDPQTRPLPTYELEGPSEELAMFVEQEGEGVIRREYKSEAERMSKEQRKQAGFKRITAYCVAEAFRMKLLAPFLKREHNVSPRVFDEALYVMYHLPLLPGYGPNTNIRSSAPPPITAGKSFLAELTEAEEDGYQGSYFPASRSLEENNDGYISTSSPVQTRKRPTIDDANPGEYVSDVPETPLLQGDIGRNGGAIESDASGSAYPSVSTTDTELDTEAETETERGYATNPEDSTGTVQLRRAQADAFSPEGASKDTTATEVIARQEGERRERRTGAKIKNAKVLLSGRYSPDRIPEDEIGEVVFFEYGVVVFFGLQENQERDILEDIERAGIMRRRIVEPDWEIEECHYAHDPHIAYPRIYNDFFTLKSRSHLLKLSIAHALAQSTLLAHYETNAQRVLSSPLARNIPQQLAQSGGLKLRRHDALKLTGLLFKLRRDVNLVSNVLDVPELFWSEASLKALYDAVRDYMEMKGRIQALNEKLGIASDFLEAIHDHLNNSAMERITWIIIWLIVVAILVELGEVVARLVVHATISEPYQAPVAALSKEEALRTLEKMLLDQTL